MTDGGRQYRYERKFVVRDLPAQHVDLLVRLSPAHFRVAYPPRFINNVYFDSPQLSGYRTHVHGSSCRRKFRVRWYGDPYGRIANPVLEVKSKRGTVGTKSHVILRPFNFHGSIDLARVEPADPNASNEAWQFVQLVGAKPALFNRYHRRYWSTTDDKYRITVDTHLEYRAVNGQGHSVHARRDDRHLTIIELKYDAPEDAFVSQVSQFLPFRLGKFSKYVSGVSSLASVSDC